MNSYKTVICKFFPDCPRGNTCTFAHGPTDLVKTKPCWAFSNGGCPNTPEDCHFLHMKTRPCWFFSNGGCKNTAKDCARVHLVVPNLRKHLSIQRPCINYHKLHSCRFGTKCRFDHFELTEKEWTYHFEGVPYPGEGYTNLPCIVAPQPRPVASTQQPIFTYSDFPPLVPNNLQQHLQSAKDFISTTAFDQELLAHLVETVSHVPADPHPQGVHA